MVLFARVKAVPRNQNQRDRRALDLVIPEVQGVANQNTLATFPPHASSPQSGAPPSLSWHLPGTGTATAGTLPVALLHWLPLDSFCH
jgi:hypothetical protein